MRFFPFCILFLFQTNLLIAQKKNSEKNINLQLLLEKFTDLSLLPQYEPGQSAQISSYDTTGMNNDGFGGQYSFIRRNEDSTLVIFEQQGPGVINRIWTPTPTTDTLEFYIDNNNQPAFKISYIDLYTGRVYPFVTPLCSNQLGGYYCYLPIPFNKSCKIVLRAKQTRFHQIGYRLYPRDHTVKSFSLPLNAAEQKALEKIRNTWEKPGLSIHDLQAATSALKTEERKLQLKPGQELTVYQSANPGRIAGFELLSSNTLDSQARNIDIRISWDNEKSPAVFCPLSDFFGYAFGYPSMKGLLIGSDGSRHYSWFPMPYDRSAKIELIYRRAGSNEKFRELNIVARIYIQEQRRDPATEGKFYAHWNRENPVPRGQPYTLLNAKGRGHMAGVVLQAQGLQPGITGFFEGDDSTVIDGEMRLHGTGSEDFFNGGWYAMIDRWDDAMSLPLSGSLGYSVPLSRTGGYRYFAGDKLSFEKSFLQTIEHGPEHNLWPADYSSVSYFYCDRPNPQPVQPTNGNTGIYLPDTIDVYPQLLPIYFDNAIAADARWDGTPAKTIFFTVNQQLVLRFSLKEIPPGNYDMYFDYQKGPESVPFSVWQRQTQVGDWTDAYSADTKKLVLQKMGELHLTELNRSVSIQFKKSGNRDKFILTRIVLVRQK